MTPRPSLFVSTAAGAGLADASAIAAGIPSRALMQRAGAAAATEIASRLAGQIGDGVVVATGAGNNGGDGWVVARALHASGISVRVVECASAHTPDARAERALAVADGVAVEVAPEALLTGGERVIVDGLLGTGYSASSPLRDVVADGIAHLHSLAARGASVVALDVPSGLDATTGVNVGGLQCAMTLTFGTIKRGQLISREACGSIVLLDIGLGVHVEAARAMGLADVRWFRELLPIIHADAHKGTRKKVAIIGGAAGMAGAAMLAARAALRSGAGMVKCVVAAESLLALQQGEPAALATEWPDSETQFVEQVASWCDALLIGPGLGRTRARAMVEMALAHFNGPVVLDADALNAFTGDANALGALIGGRQALLTPHPLEFARLSGLSSEHVLARHFDVPADLARQTGATVLLKGVPTIVASPKGECTVVAEGTPVLATGGSGDILGGIAVTLLAQTGVAATAGALAAFAHGRAASALSLHHVRGYTLDDVLQSLPHVWSLAPPPPRPPVLAELPAQWERV